MRIICSGGGNPNAAHTIEIEPVSLKHLRMRLRERGWVQDLDGWTCPAHVPEPERELEPIGRLRR